MNSAWGSVCDSAGVFTSDEAKVVCRQLGILQVEGRKIVVSLLFCLNTFSSVIAIDISYHYPHTCMYHLSCIIMF